MSTRVRRLRSHPQAKQEQEYLVRSSWCFHCPRCDLEYYLRGARPLKDGTLVCGGCFGPEDRHDLRRCETCGEMRPEAEFARDPDPTWDAIAAALGGYYSELTQCQSCRAPVDRSQDCARCGTPFTPTRSDAQYCSGRCRTAAHRQHRRRAQETA
jgi:hypothetical protein